MFESIARKVVQGNDLQSIRKNHSSIVFCSGCYDILQSGHAVFFNQCKQFAKTLVVGVGRDSTLRTLKGPTRPINPENNRLYLVAALEDVDYAILNDKEIREGKIDFQSILESLRPDVFVINDDDSALKEKAAICNRLGIRIEQVSRIVPEELTPTSSTQIAQKIQSVMKAPLRIDFAGGWTDIPGIMGGKPGFVSNVAIRPHIEMKGTVMNFGGYPRGSGLSTSTAVKALEMVNSRFYNCDAKTIKAIAEDLFNLENKELNWAIGRQDQYAIVYGGFHCWRCTQDGAEAVEDHFSENLLNDFKQGLLLLHTGISRNAQKCVSEVYDSYTTEKGQRTLAKMASLGEQFSKRLGAGDFDECGRILHENWQLQKELSPSSTNEDIDRMYEYARSNGAIGGKLCGAGGGGAFIFYADDPEALLKSMKMQFPGCFEIRFDFEMRNIKQLNGL